MDNISAVFVGRMPSVFRFSQLLAAATGWTLCSTSAVGRLASPALDGRRRQSLHELCHGSGPLGFTFRVEPCGLFGRGRWRGRLASPALDSRRRSPHEPSLHELWLRELWLHELLLRYFRLRWLPEGGGGGGDLY
jgi:hypothetical protein